MVQRWVQAKAGPGESPDVDAFLADIEVICRRHGLSIALHGGRLCIEAFDEQNMRLLTLAPDDRKLLDVSLYEADTDTLALTTTGYMLVPSKGKA